MRHRALISPGGMELTHFIVMRDSFDAVAPVTYVTFAAGSRDGRRFYVVDWNGVSADAIDAMDKYLDDFICR